MSDKPTRDDLLLAFIGEVGAARRRLQAIDRKWARVARTPEELEEARCAVMLSMGMLRRLKEARELLEGNDG